MATIKSYTDISQSKVLAEILPLESADMHYNNGSCRGVDYTEHFSAELMPYQEALHLMKIHKTNFMFQVIPCWSLVALLSVLPHHLIVNNKIYAFSTVKGLNRNGETYAIKYAIFNTTFYLHLTDFYNNPIDACYEMILKLNELNLL